MSGRVTLPQAGTGDHESARRRLGGRARSREGVGRLVQVEGDDTVAGVVVFAETSRWHVWLGQGRVLKTEHVTPLERPPSPELYRVAEAARHFATIEEGEEVVFPGRDGRLLSGTVREKCRYGALVLDAEGHLVAVGFARLQQKSSPERATN